MARLSLRRLTDNFKTADKEETNMDASKSVKILSKNFTRKRKTSTATNLKDTSVIVDESNSTISSSTKPQISNISIVCSLPLDKISGFLEKISGTTSLQNDPTYSCLIKSSKDNERIDMPSTKTLCLYCDKKFSSHIIKDKHIDKIHTLSNNRRFSSRHSNAEILDSRLEITPSLCSSQRNYNGCNYCKNTKENIVASANGLIELFCHFIDFHSDKYFACKLCKLRFQNQEKLKNHTQSQHKNILCMSDENLKSQLKPHSTICNDSEKFKMSSMNVHKTFTHRSTLSKTPNLTMCNTKCSSGMKNNVFSGDEPILSRLGVAQNRLPGNRKSLRLRRDEVINDILLKSDHNASRSRTRSRVGKSFSSGEYSDVVFRIPTKNDNMSCVFDDNFYEKVVSNVRDNILYYLDGKIFGNTSETDSTHDVGQHFRLFHATFQFSDAMNNEIHTATQIRPSTTFPTLLTAEQYGADVTTKIKRSITKYSWKWKWDSFKKFKFVNEGGKIIKKLKQSTVSLRDLSKLDMWTQLTMREKNDLNKAIVSRSNVTLSREKKQKLNEQLNYILDTRLLPHIILEQSEETIIKIEYEDNLLPQHNMVSGHNLLMLENSEHPFLSLLNLIPKDLNCVRTNNSTLSGEWARPRCYLCIGCGTKFDKLKSLEEHKMFRHSHVYSTHYEIVGRELMASNLLKRFFIPKRAFSRYGSTICFTKMHILNKPETAIQNKINILPEEESSDSIQSILNSVVTTHSSKNSIDGCDTDSKATINMIEASPTNSIRSVCSSVSFNSLHIGHQKENDSFFHCTKCKRKCSGVLELYRHMLDCSGDYIWNMAKKRKYRYYCGSKKRRQCKKRANKESSKKKQSSCKESINFTEGNESSSYTKIKTPPRQRPSDADSIKKMLENLPPKRVCKKIFPHINKARKSKLIAKRKKFNSQVLKHKLSKRIRQTRSMRKSTSQNFSKSSKSKCKKQNNLQRIAFEKQVSSVNTTQGINSSETISCSRTVKENSPEKKVIESNECVNERCNQYTQNANNEIAASTQTLISPFNKLKILEDSVGPKNNSKENLRENTQPAESECSVNNGAETSLLIKDQSLPNNLEEKNLKKRRCKKIHECIAMLTGKLEEKLKTDKPLELNNKNTSCENKSDSLSVNKTAKRKACSRRIIKLPVLNNNEDCNYEKIPSVVSKNLILNSEELEQSLKTNIVPVEIRNKEMSLPGEIPKVVSSDTECFNATSKDQNFSTHDIKISKPLEPPDVIRNTLISKPFPYSTYKTINLSDSNKFTNNGVNQIQSLAVFQKNNIPKRRQTICGEEGFNFSTKLYDDIQPLDLSKKSKDFCNPTPIENARVSVCNESQTNKSDTLTISSPIIQMTPFYSSLDLLKIPQVKNPCHLNAKCCKPPLHDKNSKRRAIGQTVVKCSDDPIIITKKTTLNRKQNLSKHKNTPKMNEDVINHIDDAINSVINAEKELAEQENVNHLMQCCNEQENTKDFGETSLSKTSSFGNEVTLNSKGNDPSNKIFTPLKRSSRSKTVDCISSAIEISKISEVTTNLCENQNDNNMKKVIDVEIPKLCNEADSKKEESDKNMGVSTTAIVCNVSLPEEKYNEIEKVDKLHEVENISKECQLPKESSSDVIQVNDTKPRRRRRKNELAAIVADQLLESFKMDKARRENLKKLEDMAYDKSKDLLLTGMLLTSNTKRTASIPLTSHQELPPDKNEEFFKRKKQDQSKKTKSASKANEKNKNKNMNEAIKEPDLKKSKKKSIGLLKHSTENSKTSNISSCVESFQIDSITQKPEISENETTKANSSLEVHDSSKYNVIAPKQCQIIKPSLLSMSLEPAKTSYIIQEGKCITSSRDPRLNKNIHKDEHQLDIQLISKNNLDSHNINENNANTLEDVCDAEDDKYLKEIANNVNEKIQSSENKEFKFINDEFDVGLLMQDDSINPYRPSTSMSVRSAPNLNDCNSNFGSMGENTNTECIDMDLDDNMSVYTSFSQDINRSGRKRRRRSILLTRRPKKKSCRDGLEEKFECLLCKKTFYAASSLAKHQTTLAHVSKVSEQEYFLSKKQEIQENDSQAKQQKIVEKIDSLQQKEENVLHNKTITENNIENLKNKNNYNLSRLKLNPDERLFFECCNILKGTQTSKPADLEINNCAKYTFAYQDKNNPDNLSTAKNHPLSSSSFINEDGTNKNVPERISQNLKQIVFNDQPLISSQLKSKTSEDILTAVDQNNSFASRISTVTNTTSRFKTKAAMKGYENPTVFNINHESKLKSRSLCKLTALAEIALGNENSNSQNLVIPETTVINKTQQNSPISFHNSLSETAKEIDANNTKQKKQSANHHCSTSSKTIMHLSVIKNSADQKDIKEKSDKIVIPERPFKNIGLEEKETIKFQKPKTTVSLLNPTESSVSSMSYSDREFDFESLSCDDEITVYNSNSKIDKNNSSSTSSSKSTCKTFENKSLIMGRIFKNANGGKMKNMPRKACIPQNDSIVKTDLNQIFDELRGNSVPKIKSVENDDKGILDNVSVDFEKNEQISTVLMNPRNTKKKKSIKEKQKQRKNFSNIKSELGMRSEEIALLLSEGQRKSKRRCATNRPKKLIEMWSSDEYEEFLSTKDIFALIEEKEKEDTRKRRKNNTFQSKACTKETTKTDKINYNMTTRATIKPKSMSNKKQENKSILKLDKKKSTGSDAISNNSEQNTIPVSKNAKKLKHKSKQKDKVKKLDCRDDVTEPSTENRKQFELIKEDKVLKRKKKEIKSPVNSSYPRRKRLSSEKLYYWSSSSDEDFGRITGANTQNFDSREQFKKHGWIVGDSHKKLVTLLAIAKGNKKVDSCGVKKKNLRKRVK